MATVDVAYSRSKSSRVANAKAAKEKRQKIIVAVAGVMFLLLLAIQVPRTLKMLNPPTTAAPATEAAAPGAAPAAEAEAGSLGRTAAELRAFLAQFDVKDPFAERSIRAAAGVPIRPTAPGQVDPFSPKPVAASDGPIRAAAVPVASPAKPAAPAKPATDDRPGYTIVLASIPAHIGSSAATGTAQGARARGIDKVGVLRSSDYPLLRPGYTVVHSRIFDTRAEAQEALAYARANGYRTAYIRQLK